MEKMSFLYIKLESFHSVIHGQKKQQKNTEIRNIEKSVTELETSISSGKSSLEVEYVHKNNLENYYDYIIEGTVIRSRAQWYEDEEKCTKIRP